LEQNNEQLIKPNLSSGLIDSVKTIFWVSLLLLGALYVASVWCRVVDMAVFSTALSPFVQVYAPTVAEVGRLMVVVLFLLLVRDREEPFGYAVRVPPPGLQRDHGPLRCAALPAVVVDRGRALAGAPPGLQREQGPLRRGARRDDDRRPLLLRLLRAGELPPPALPGDAALICRRRRRRA
jgi:hypothetical protein